MQTRFRSTLVFLFDLLAVVVAWVGGFLVRFNLEWPDDYAEYIVEVLPILLVLHALACWRAGLYRGIWVFASLPDLKRVLRAVAISGLTLVLVAALLRATPATPRSMLLLYPMILLVVMGGGRVVWRMWKEYRLYGRRASKGSKPVVVVGAGTGGAMLVNALDRTPDWEVVALVDDDPKKIGLELNCRPILGPIDSLPDILADHRTNHVIFAMPSTGAPGRRRVADLAIQAGARMLVVPGLDDLMSGNVTVKESMRPIAIDDLLGREPIMIDSAHVHDMVAGKVVLVTGAGGSIGSELCRQLARFAPARIVLVELNEYALYSIDAWFAEHRPGVPIVPLAGDVKDDVRMSEIFQVWTPAVVFHAAAYKHVPLMEVGNAWQAVRNNVLGTWQVASQAVRHGVDRFVLISTDKAVNPTNVMGATKRMAEMVCQALQARNAATRFSVVRFGNVLGSAGSVIPKFQEQIARGGPVTVTHPDINRYFMSIPEAAQLVLQAASMGEGGEIFVLDMGDPVKIVDLARNMIRLAGYDEGQIRIEFTGLRPGEKLYEELLADAEQTIATRHSKLRVARCRPAAPALLDSILIRLAQRETFDDDQVRSMLQGWIPEYAPVPRGSASALQLIAGSAEPSGNIRQA